MFDQHQPTKSFLGSRYQLFISSIISLLRTSTFSFQSSCFSICVVFCHKENHYI